MYGASNRIMQSGNTVNPHSRKKNVKDRFCAFGHDYIYVYSYVLRVQRREMGPLILHPSCKNHVRHTEDHILFIPELKRGDGFNK